MENAEKLKMYVETQLRRHKTIDGKLKKKECKNAGKKLKMYVEREWRRHKKRIENSSKKRE
jgi:hypothetical protein